MVLNGALFAGSTGNAGALGCTPVHVGGRTSQLIQHASLITLEKSLIRHGVVASVTIIDFPRVCIDRVLPQAVRAAIVEMTRVAAAAMDLQGLSPFEIVAGTIGADARALGGTMLPILAGYVSDPEVLLKDIGAGARAARTA